MRRTFLPLLLSVLPCLQASGQVTLRLAETPVRGADVHFLATGTAHKQWIFVLSAAQGPNNRLSLIDPRDPRVLGVDLGRVAYAAEGAFDAFGRARMVVPEPLVRIFQTMPFYAQCVTYPGITTLIDDLSNVISSRVGTGVGGVSGVVKNDSDKPLAGVVVHLEGNVSKTTRTDANGSFTLNGIPPGRQHIVIDATAVDAGCTDCNLPRVVMLFDIEDGKVKPFDFIIYLPVAKGGTLITGPLPIDTVVTHPDLPDLKLTLPKGTVVKFPNGDTQGQKVQLVRVLNERTPMPIPDQYRAKWDFAVYPPGTSFDLSKTTSPNGAPITLVIDEVWTLNSEWDLMAPDHDSLPLQMESVGKVRVTGRPAGGGSILTTISGGVRGGSWHMPSRPPDPPCPPFVDCDPCPGGAECCTDKCCDLPNGSNCTVGSDHGYLRGGLSTISYRTADGDWRLSLNYNSARAAPRPVLPFFGGFTRAMMLPSRLSISGKFGDFDVGEHWYDTSGFPNLTDQTFAFAKDVALDPSKVPSGEYRFRFLLRSHFGESDFASEVKGSVFIENESQSPFGAGWTLAGLQRLVAVARDRVLLCRGDGSRLVYQADRRARNVAGTGVAGYLGDNVQATSARLNRPDHIAADLAGNLYVVDGANHVVRKISKEGMISLVAGTPGKSGNAGDDGPARQAQVDFTVMAGVYEGGVAVDELGQRLFIADQGNHRIRYVDLKTGNIHAFAGTGVAGYAGDGGDPKQAQFNHPCALAFDAQGRLWITDTENQVIRRIDAAGKHIGLIAGTAGQRGYAGDGGPATMAKLNYPDAIAVDPFGTAYVADSKNHLVRRITVSGRIERFLGTGAAGTAPIEGDRHRLRIPINSPADLAVDDQGNLLASLADLNQIVLVGADDMVEVLSASNNVKVEDRPQAPTGLVLGPDGNLYFCETPFHRVRSLSVFGGSMKPVSGPQNSYVLQARDGTYTAFLPDLTQDAFDKSGRMLEHRFPTGRAVKYEHDTAGLLVKVTIPNGLSHTLEYASGKLTKITDPAGRSYAVVIQNGNLVEWRAPGPSANVPSVTRFEYDGALLKAMLGPGGGRTDFTRNGAGQYLSALMTGTGLGNGINWQTTPRSALAMPGAGDDRGGKDKPLKALLASNRIVHIDPNGHPHTYELDSAGRISKYIDPNAKETLYELDASGLPTAVIRPGGARTEYTYDDMGRTLTIRLPMRAPTELWRFEYVGSIAQPVKVTNPRGFSTTFDVDDRTGKIQRVVDATGLERTYFYDTGRDLLNAIVEPYGSGTRQVTFAYDALERQTRITDPLGRHTTLAYVGNTDTVASRTDGNNNTTWYEYTPAGSLAKVTDPLGCASEYQYDDAGNLVTFIDAKKCSTAFKYDSAGRRIERKDPVGNSEFMTYDAGGNLASKTTRNSVTITYAYDKFGHLLSKSTMTGSLGTFTYDDRGNMLSAINADATVRFTYDLADRLLTETSSGQHQPTTTIIHAYDANDNDVRSSWAGYTVDRRFDELDRVARLSDSASGPSHAEITITYDANYRRASLVRSNGVTTTYTWDAADQMRLVRHMAATKLLSEWTTVEYDGLGNPTRINEQRGGTFVAGTNSYTYDKKSQLLSASHPDAQNPLERFAYDCVGNRLYNGQPRVDCADRLLTSLTHSYRYDSDGALTEKTAITTGATTVYSWSVEDRLVEVREYAGMPTGTPRRTTSFYYDAFGRRVRRRVHGSDMQDNAFIMSGAKTVMLSTSSSTGSYTVLHSGEIDEPLATLNTVDGKRTWYCASPVRSIELVTDGAGQAAYATLHSAFGARVAENGQADVDASLFGYAGRESDINTLRYHRARYVDSDVGRFLSEDVIWRGDQRYYYAINCPTRYGDPDGRIATVVIVGGAIVAGVCLLPLIDAFRLASEADRQFPSDPDGRRRHCWINCKLIREGFLLPCAALTASSARDPWWVPMSDDSKQDWQANFHGMRVGYRLRRDCREECDKCPLGQ